MASSVIELFSKFTFSKTFSSTTKRSVTYRTYRRGRSWVRSGNLRTLRKQWAVQGYAPSQPYRDELWLFEPGSAEYTAESPDPWNRGSGNGTGGLEYFYTYGPGNSIQVQLRNSALSALDSKVAQADFNIGVTGAEFGKTTNMFYRAASTLAAAANNVRHGRFGDAALLLGLTQTPSRVNRNRSFANNWLEYRYGWRLVAQDVYNGMVSFYNLSKGRPFVVCVKVQRGREVAYTIPPTRDLPNDVGSFMPVTGIVSGKGIATFSEGLVCRFQVSNRSLDAGASLGLTNPLSLAWELIPYSFVVDWFVNVGDVLNSLSVWHGKKFLDGCRTSVVQHDTKTWVSDCSPNPYFGVRTKIKTLSPSRSLQRNFDRIVLTAPPSTSLNFAVNLNTSRIIDAVALFGQKLRR